MPNDIDAAVAATLPRQSPGDVDAAVAAALSGQTVQDPAAAARFGMQQALGTNPDLYSELRKVSQVTGVPISSVEAHPEEVKRQATLGATNFDELASVAPSTASLLSNIDTAKLSHDDVGTLTAVERAVRSFVTPDRSQPTPPIFGLKVGRSSDFTELVQAIKSRQPGLDWDTARGLAAQQMAVDNQSDLIGPVRQPAPTLMNIVRGMRVNTIEAFRAANAGISAVASDALGFDPTQAVRQYGAAKARGANASPQFETATGAGLYGGAVSLLQNTPGIVASVLTANPVPGLALSGITAAGTAFGRSRRTK